MKHDWEVGIESDEMYRAFHYRVCKLCGKKEGGVEGSRCPPEIKKPIEIKPIPGWAIRLETKLDALLDLLGTKAVQKNSE